MRWLSLIGLMLISCFLVSCTNSKNGPEQVAIAFFQAIYVEHDIAQAQTLSAPKLRQLLIHYRTVKAVQRYVVGMVISAPKIELQRSSAKRLWQQSETVTIELLFTSSKNQHAIYEVRTVIVGLQPDQSWRVVQLVDDPFSRPHSANKLPDSALSQS